MSGTLSVVVPVYNQAAEIGRTLQAVAAAARRSRFAVDIVVVDDGSVDGSAEAARAGRPDLPVRVLSQANAGRLAARRAGLEQACGDYVLLLDSRVTLAADALRFVEQQLDRNPQRIVWNGHVDIVVDGNPYAAFWDVLTRRAFATYFSNPRTTSFGLDDFEGFPKGTTCFFAPRRLLLEAFGARRSGYADERYANDDTPAIRWIAGRARINISPGFRCDYEARRTLGAFLRHAFHRGTVFVDGHGHVKSRYGPVIVAFYPLSAAWVWLGRRSLAIAGAPLALAAAGGALLALSENRKRDAWRIAVVAPLYVVAHGAGMWRGAALFARGYRLRRARG